MDGYEVEGGGVMRESVSCKGGSLTRGRRKEGKWGQGINRDLTVCLGGEGEKGKGRLAVRRRWPTAQKHARYLLGERAHCENVGAAVLRKRGHNFINGWR